MKRILIILAIVVNCTLLIDNCMSQWVQQSVPVTGGYFNDMKFVNANTGFILNWNNPLATFMRTTNAGYNWQSLNNWGMAHIAIVDTGCIYTSGQNDFGKIYKSSNLGITWDSMLTTTSYYSYLHFFNRDTGIISGGNSFNNFIWRTTNGCQSLQLITTYEGADPGKLFFLKEKVNGEYYGWMYYPGGRSIFTTTNSGLNWVQLPSFPGWYGLNSIYFTDKDIGWATIANYTNYIYKTTNSGLNWEGKYINLNEYFTDIYFANTQKGWVSGPSYKICVTTNGGNNWGTQNIQGDFSGKLFFLDSNTGWVQSLIGAISHTTNGGGTITSIISGSTETQKDYKLYQNYPNPFNPITNVKFSIANGFPVRTSGNDKVGRIVLKVYDIQGREVQTLVNETLKPGTYETTFDASALPTGIYFYQLFANGIAVQTRKMILLK